MGRHTGPTDKLSRREGINLMLKGARSESGKIERRMVPPGMHAWRRGRGSEYRVRLRETQKVKRYLTSRLESSRTTTWDSTSVMVGGP